VPAINFLIKPSSNDCNLNCTYCFYQSLANSRSVKSYGKMKIETLEAIVAKGLAYADGFCSFAFQGGEPTLVGLGFYEQLIRFEKKYRKNKRIKISNSIQTNGMIIDEKWADFLHKNDFLVGLSLDGSRDTHDAFRKDAAGKGSFNKVMHAANTLNRHQVNYNILTVISSATVRHAGQIYDLYKKNNFKYLQFINCLDPLNTKPGVQSYSPKPKKVGAFLNSLFDRWYQDFKMGSYVSIRYFENLLSIILGEKPEACNMSGNCQNNIVIEADGSVYPCDFYVNGEWKTGNIKLDSIGQLLASEKASDFINESLKLSETCNNCKWLWLCKGGCRRECEPLHDSAGRTNYFCEAYRMFFEYAYGRLEQVAKSLC